MKKSLAKLKKKAGFTLVEALIVLAILGVLAAVAIPAYSIQLENSRQKVDENTAATAGSMAVSDYLLNNYTGSVSYQVYTQTVGTNVNLKIVPTNPPAGAPAYDTTGFTVRGGVSTANKSKTVAITVKDGTLIKADWTGAAPHT